eukprot:gene12227-biopygen7555
MGEAGGTHPLPVPIQTVIATKDTSVTGSALHFSEPIRWWRCEAQTIRLQRESRLMPVTTARLWDKGARWFCWLMPYENAGLGAQSLPHGKVRRRRCHGVVVPAVCMV